MKSINRLLACAMLALLPAIYAAPAQAANATPLARPAASGSAVVAAPASQDESSAGNPFPVALPVTLDAQGAHSVRTADFDQDGDRDVIVASRGDGNIVLHLNQGTQPPSFAAYTLATAEGSYMAVPADLNHDGWTDVVVAAVGVIDPSAAVAGVYSETAVLGTGKVFWLQNKLAQGEGFTVRAIAEGLNYPVAVEAVDLNRDDRLDVVVATRDDGRILWYENNGDAGSFAVRLAAENLTGAAAIHTGDFDNDGRTDLVAAAEDSNQIVWLRNGGGQSPAFEPRLVRNGPTPPAGQDFAKAVFAADLDRDGDTDIVFASEQQNQIGWYENLGRGAAFSEHLVAGDMPHAKSVYAADLDRDGDTDILATAAETGVVAFYENKRGAPVSFVAHTVQVGSLGAHSVTAADMDKDGDLDVLAAAREANSVLLYPNLASHRTAVFDPQAQYVVGTYREPRMAAAADMDSDGDLDIVSVADEVVAWHRNEGGSPPNFTRIIITQGLSGGRWIHAADIDADGDQDLFVADTLTDRILWYENQLSAPGAMPGFAERLVTNQAVGVRDVHSADLDSDGRLDLYSANDSDNTVTWFEQKSGSVSFERKVVTNAARYVRSAYAADLNLDGMLDLISASAEDNLVAWYDNRGGSPLNWIQRVLSTEMAGARHVHAGDLDGDGDMDVVAGAELNNTIAWYENKRGLFSNFNQRVISDNAGGVHSVITGDADRDGDLDVFAALEGSEQLVWYENNGARQPEFSPHIIGNNFPVAHSIALGDLDGDGDEDVIGTSRGGGQVAWFENLGGQYNLSQSAPQSPSSGLQALLHLVFTHKGRSGDPAMRTNAITLRFTTAGRALTSVEAAGLFTRLAIYHDSNYNGVFEPDQDAQLASADSLLLDGAGQLLIPLPADQPGVQIGVGGAEGYFVAGETRSGGCLSTSSVQVAHIANALTVVNQQTSYRMAGEAMRGIDSLGAPQDNNQIRVQINEIMADNTRTLEDPDEPQEYPDWIELYNGSSVAVNLGGMYLSDDPANAQGYRIPDNVTIGANSYLVFIADEETEQGPLHTNFRLSKGGEGVTLIDKAARSYRLLDQVEYDGMAEDVSYGRYPNGGSDWQALGAATPGSYNLNEPLVIRAYLYAPVIATGAACR